MNHYFKRDPQRLPSIITIVLVFAIGFLTGWGVFFIRNTKDVQLERREGQYEFVNPLLECEGAEDLISGELVPFKDKIIDLVEREKEENKIKDVSVYFRDMNDGPWFGLNEKELFVPGSLLKIPIMIGYLKEAESNPAILKREIKFDRKLPVNVQYIKPSETMEFGKSYTVEELIYRMIVNSDNDAAYLLIQNDNAAAYEKVFKDLGLPLPPYIGPYEVSVRRYTSFFRILFNASYLNKEMSNIALKILSNADFDRGLVAGVPSNVPVAQKFGEITTEEYKQFHDCGIIYYPKNPYLLCVMTKGDDYEKLASVIRDVSRLVYEEVDRQVQVREGGMR